jgi:hypothetical protein
MARTEGWAMIKTRKGRIAIVLANTFYAMVIMAPHAQAIWSK